MRCVKIKGSNGVTEKGTGTTINDHLSRIGFKGSEKLSEDTKLIWQMEQRVSTVSQYDGWGTRDSFIGLEGDFGKIRAGYLSNQYNEMVDLDKWIFNRGSALGLSSYNREGKRVVSARYDSPVFNGFQGIVQYAPRDNKNPGDRYTHQEAAQDELMLGLKYKSDKAFAKSAYSHKKNNYADGNGKLKDGYIARIDGGLYLGNLEIGAGVQHAKGNESGNKYLSLLTGNQKTFDGQGLFADKTEAVKVTDAAIALTYRAGNWQPQLVYAHGWAAKGVNSKDILVDKYDQVVIGGDYHMSKRTSIRGQAGYLVMGG
ncbi:MULTISPECIES: porin [Neisseria]|uniref:porin n=1 Tax=Neisseria TaxID=482 RepID=UPI001E3FAB19|nr:MULTISPECIES: porin [Neisseria]